MVTEQGRSMETALLIEFNASTGKRAGGISPKNPDLLCHGWQDLESVPAREIRLVMKGNASAYEDIPGVTILKGKDEINNAIDIIKPDVLSIENEILFLEDLRQRNINLSDYQGQSQEQILTALNNTGIVGICVRKAEKV